MKIRDGTILGAVSKMSTNSIANNAKNAAELGSAVVCVGVLQSEATISA